MYFIGVTTRQSSINAIFPRWAQRLGLRDGVLQGIDLPLHDAPANYRAVVEFIKRDPLSLGALVTSHKVDLWHACRDQFDEIEPLSNALGEISSIYKRSGRLLGRSVDPWTVGDALDAVLPRDHWQGGAEALILGAGGAGTAFAWQISQSDRGANRPRRLHAVDQRAHRLEHLRHLHATWSNSVPLACHLVVDARAADDVLAQLPGGSLVVNATGAGKDTPGSPLSDAVVFPRHGIVWDFNYRGELRFLQQARRQQAARELAVHDGWIYFVHGWMRVIADVFGVEIPTSGPLFHELSAMAAVAR